MVPFVDLKTQDDPIREQIDRAIREIVENTAFVGGKTLAGFEDAFARFCGVKHGIGAASGTAALHAALLAGDVGPGDEVVTVSHTFGATAEAILQAGAQPVFVDIDADTYTMNPERVEDAITARTKAIIPVHLYGQCADMNAIRAIARRHNLLLIEDAAQAHGAKIGDRRAGSFGDMACFSFYPAKNLGAYGDAGITVTDNDALAERLRLVVNHGSPDKYHHTVLGYNYRLDTLQAAILNVKLGQLETWNERRRAAAKKYHDLLSGIDGVVTPVERYHHVYHLYVVRVPERDRLRKHLDGKGIATGLHYPVPMHLQPILQDHPQSLKGSLPVTERVVDEILSLPMFPTITGEQIEEVASGMREFPAF